MGSATTICSDKTGILTLNEMTVSEAYIGGRKTYCPDNTSFFSATAHALIIEGVALNTAGSVFTSDTGEVEISGSPTEKAILSWGVKLGMNFEELRSQCKLLHVFPFNSEKKRGGVALQLPDSQVHIHWKGAAEIVLSSCTEYLDADGSCRRMDEGMVKHFKDAISEMASNSLRCVALAYKAYAIENDSLAGRVVPGNELILLAIIGLKDPCRPGVREAVERCTKAGVKVCMVTGDSPQTAKAIALECGILASDVDAMEPAVIEGKTFRDMFECEREDIAGYISVMFRSSPIDKLLLVKALKKRGHVVAVTGHRLNDVPALKEADVGLAMGIQCTEVAKESSDIIILDDNLVSVVNAVHWGRSVYANIQKISQFQLTINIAALVINAVAAVSSGEVLLNTVQLLWVTIIKDTVGALALATEPPTDRLMDSAPVWKSPITNIMWRNIFVQAMYQVIVLLILYFKGESMLHLTKSEHDIKVKNTLIFNAFVLAQLFNMFNARRSDEVNVEVNVFTGITRNRLFMGIVSVTLVLQILIIFFMGKFTSTVPLSWQLWLLSVGIGFISWPLSAVGKLYSVPAAPLSHYLIYLFTRQRQISYRYKLD